MSDYSQITFFTPKDGLATGNPNKIIYGSDVDAELSAISTAIATKADVDGDAIGAGTPATELSVDNLKLDANKIISTNTDGDIELEPNGAGYVVITNVDVAAGEIDGTTIGATTAAAGTFTTANATTVDTTNLEVTNLKAKDGTAAGSIADVTGVVTLASSVLTTTDINGGTIDGAIIGGATPAAITGTTLTANTSLALATGATVTAILDEDNMASDSATALATQQSIKAYVDAQVTAQDLDVTTDSGTIAIDLDSETLTVAGGTGLDTSATGNTVTVAIDSTVATLTGAQTLTNKVLTSPDINTPDIDGGNIDGTVIGAATPAAGSFTTLQADTSLNVDGTVTADGLTFSNEGDTITFNTSSTPDGRIKTGDSIKSNSLQVEADNAVVINSGQDDGGVSEVDGTFISRGSTFTKTALFDVNGDISFYEDTGTTPKFFWDASAEKLGIGTSTGIGFTVEAYHPTDNGIARFTSGDGNVYIALEDINSTVAGNIIGVITDDMYFSTAGSERMRIASDGGFSLSQGTGNNFRVIRDGDNVIEVGNYSATDGYRSTRYISSTHTFYVASAGAGSSSRAVDIDSSGNLLVGKTSSSGATAGAELRPAGDNVFTRSSGQALTLRRNNSDGSILEFSKDGATVGSIGTVNGFLGIGTDDTGLVFINSDNTIRPFDPSSNTDVDDSITLGESSRRFKDLYLSGGVYLGGTGAVNLLDDYEEGTWTPTITPATGSFTSIVYSSVEGFYTKIGNMVYFSMFLRTTNSSDFSGASGDIVISGLPFTSAASPDYFGASVTNFSRWASNSILDDALLMAAVGANSTNISLRAINTSVGDNASFTTANLSNAQTTNNRIGLSGFYQAA